MDLQKITADLSELPRQWSPDVIASRVETGPLQINEDWPSVHIRGDNAAWFAMQLDQAIDLLKKYSDKNNFHESIIISSVESISELMKSCLNTGSITDNEIGC